MYGDTTAIRHLATELRHQGAEIRIDADLLSARAAAAPWQGRAADAMRTSASRQVAGLRRTADLHDEAATALRRHARAVEEVKGLIAAIERQVQATVDEARSRLADLVGTVADPLDDLFDHVSPPPCGSRDWLHVDLPGLHLAELPKATAG